MRLEYVIKCRLFTRKWNVMERSLMWWDITWLVEYMSSMRKMVWHSYSAVTRYVLIGLFISYSWHGVQIAKVFLLPSHNTEKSVIPLIWNIHACSIAFYIKWYYVFKLQCFWKRMHIQIYGYLPKPITHSNLFLRDLHRFCPEWVNMKEALKAIEMLGNFPFSWLKKSLTLHTWNSTEARYNISWIFWISPAFEN